MYLLCAHLHKLVGLDTLHFVVNLLRKVRHCDSCHFQRVHRTTKKDKFLSDYAFSPNLTFKLDSCSFSTLVVLPALNGITLRVVR